MVAEAGQPKAKAMVVVPGERVVTAVEEVVVERDVTVEGRQKEAAVEVESWPPEEAGHDGK